MDEENLVDGSFTHEEEVSRVSHDPRTTWCFSAGRTGRDTPYIVVEQLLAPTWCEQTNGANVYVKYYTRVPLDFHIIRGGGRGVSVWQRGKRE